MIIRPMIKSDYNEIAELIMNELGYPDQKHMDVYKRLDVIEGDDNYHTLVALEDNHVVGFIGLCKFVTYEKAGYVSILAFAVSKEYQRKGIGKALLIAAQDFAKKNEINHVRVSSAFHREETHLFYEANGFERTGYTFIMAM